MHWPDAEIGEKQVCLNGQDVPVCEIQTLAMQTLPFAAVTPEMAAREGEGDLSYRCWRDAHQTFFEREGSWAADMHVIFETFEVTRILDPSFAEAAPAHVKAERAEAFAKGYTALGASHGE